MGDDGPRIISGLLIPNGQWQIPVIVAVFGLPGSGKSYLTQTLAARLPLIVLSTDEIRLRLPLPSGPATHALMFEAAGVLLRDGRGIIWDGIHLARQNRVQMRDFAWQHGAHVEIVQTVASSEVIAHRLDLRSRDPDRVAREGKFVISPDHFARIASYLEPPTLDEGVTIVRTDEGTDDQFRPLIERLGKLKE